MVVALDVVAASPCVDYYAAALYDAVEFFKPVCGPSQPAWIRVADRVTSEVIKKSDDATWSVDATACHTRFKWFQGLADPTGGAESPDPVKRLIGSMKELQVQLDQKQVGYLDDIIFVCAHLALFIWLAGCSAPELEGLWVWLRLQ